MFEMPAAHFLLQLFAAYTCTQQLSRLTLPNHDLSGVAKR
jgi:hypothetical protein